MDMILPGGAHSGNALHAQITDAFHGGRFHRIHDAGIIRDLNDMVVS